MTDPPNTGDTPKPVRCTVCDEPADFTASATCRGQGPHSFPAKPPPQAEGERCPECEEHYLPMDCPVCSRRRLLYDPQAHTVHCEKCRVDFHDTDEPTPTQQLSAAQRWRQFPHDIRQVVLDEMDRESESEDVTDAFQTARRVLYDAEEGK